MRSRWFARLVTAGALCLPLGALADTTQTPASVKAKNLPHHVHKVAKKALPPLPNGPRGPVPQVALDSLPAVPPEVTFQSGLLTITAPNSTLGDVLRAVRKETSADIDVPANANERVAVHLGPAPPRDVMADLLNGSHFNYILLGSPENISALVRVVLVAKTGPDNPDTATAQANATPAPVTAKPADDADAADNTVDPAVDQAATEADETPPDEPGVKTPQEMLQEMQQRQLQLQQQQQQQQQGENNGQSTPTPGYPPPGGVMMPQRPPMVPQQPPQEQ
jgi:pyruvate/2-oxoglutarate dehydrogenase complex dihydrolipoamide acyltransferase (E2) component